MEEDAMIELLHQYATKLNERVDMEELLYQYVIKLNERVDTLEKNLESLTIETLYEQKPELETKKPKKRFGLFGGKKPKRRIKYTYGIYTGNY